MSATRAAVRNLRRWREQPATFVHEQFGVDPDPWQLEVLEAFASKDPDKRRISMQACAGPGKSTVLAWCGLNFLSCYGEKGEHPKGAAISTTGDNLDDNLWPEFAKWMSRSPYLREAFTWTKSRIFANDHPETWFLSARSFAKTASPEEQGRTLSGLHSRYVLAIVDESGDIPLAVLKAAEQALSNCRFGKILQAGNPTSHSGMLYAAATRLRKYWHVITVTGDPLDPRRSPRIPVEYAQEAIDTYGRDDPWVKAYILGQFPPASFNALLGPEEVQAAMARHHAADVYDWAAKVIGVDVARFGPDRTTLFPRQGLVAFRPVIMRNQRTTEVAARVSTAIVKWDADAAIVDGDGLGAGPIDSLVEAGWSPIEVHGSGKSANPRYFNKRSEMLFLAAEWVKKGGALPPMAELIAEATAAQYTIHEGKLKVEEKDQIKKRIGFSPDVWDGLCLTFAAPVAPRRDALGKPGPALGGRGGGGLLHEWDPYAERPS